MDTESLFDTSDDGTFVPFTDILFNVVMGFSFMVFIAFALIKPEAKTAVELKAEFLIDVTWPDNNPDDVDTYVRDPAGDIVWYHSKEAGLMNLERDDRGLYRDTMVIGGERVVNPLNQETVTLRGIVPGEYQVNVVDYANASKAPVPVTVTVTKINPIVETVFNGTEVLEREGEERTAVRFTLNDDGSVSDVVTGGGESLMRAVRAPVGGNAPRPDSGAVDRGG